ncbi:MAG: dTDP-glucose 4,6-dehydratase [Rickettsiales bacterium]|nr:dTDP-glucose 4,6-dehydratase [Rickettsiales bacterium]
MKTILVTGGLGFIGSNFVLQEIASGNRVINLDKVTYAANYANVKPVESNANYQLIKGDICDNNLVKKIFDENKIDWVAHFAAESHVDNSIEKPSEFIETNILGTYNLLQNSLQYYKDKKPEGFRFLHVSTDEVFGSLEENSPKFNEDTKYDPSSPYSSSKAASDHLVKAWHRTYGLPILMTNCSNNYGPRQHKEKLIPKIIFCCLEEKPIPIYGKGNNVRDWIFVEDHCKGIKLTFEKGRIGESYLFGGNCEKTNIEVVNTICDIMDKRKPRKNGASYKDLINFVTDRLGHYFRYAIDGRKALAEFGYNPKPDFAGYINKTIDYYIS